MAFFHAVTTWIALGWLVSTVMHVMRGRGRGEHPEVAKEVSAFLFCIACGPALVLMALFAKGDEK